jgi:hypothetical protein
VATNEPDDDSSESLSITDRLRRAPWGTIISLGFLLLAATILYLMSRSSAVQLSTAAHILATSARKVAVVKGDDGALERELVLNLSDIQRRDDWSEALLHLAMACFVAIVIILTVEMYSSSRTRREIMDYRDSIAKEVWSAMAGRLIPSGIVDEIQGILKAEAIKDDVHYTLTFLTYPGLPDDIVVLQRKMTYTIRNMTGRHVIHTVRSLIHNTDPEAHCTDKTGAAIKLPRHVELQVNGKLIPLGEHEKTLRRNKYSQLHDLVYDIELGRRNDHADVFVWSEEPIRLSGSNPYVQTVPVTGLTVRVENRIEDRVKVQDVKLAHPNWQEFKPDADGVYRYTGALLPGQAFSIHWESVQAGEGNTGIKKV